MSAVKEFHELFDSLSLLNAMQLVYERRALRQVLVGNKPAVAVDSDTAAEMALFSAALESIETLQRDFKIYDYLKRRVYLLKPGNGPNITTRQGTEFLCRQLDVETQHKMQAILRRAEHADALDYQKAIARPDAQAYEKLTNLTLQTHIGASLLAQVPLSFGEVLFADFSGAARETFNATNRADDGNILLNRRHRQKPTLKNAGQKTGLLVHEIAHKKQQQDFPELFAELSVIDSYVATKLLEALAYTVQAVHDREYVLKDAGLWSDKLRDSQFLVPDGNIYRVMGVTVPRDIKLGRRRWTNPQLAFIENFSRQIKSGYYWMAYEDTFHTPAFIDILKTGTFSNQVAASPFMQPDFLRRLCVTPDGQSFLPVNIEPFRQTLVDWVTTLHHPYLSTFAPKAVIASPRP